MQESIEMTLKPYIIIPNLIIQPTWGGKYIAEFKKLNARECTESKVGQSYELYESTHFSSKISTLNNPSFEIGDPNDPEKTTLYGEENALNIRDLILQDPIGVLGSKALSHYGSKMGVLIKFTQAKGNSFQLHVTKDQGGWQSKPESWYYFEPGIITLGVKDKCNWVEYEKACRYIDKKAKELSDQVHKGFLTVIEAEEILNVEIKNSSIINFVNTIEVGKDEAIDLSPCGIHHSWEEDDLKYPLGNVVYEVQKNVYDPVSTIRAFDKGKFKADGTIRPLQIDEYFKFIDRSKKANNPKEHKITSLLIEKKNTYAVNQVFKNTHYQMHKIDFEGILKNKHTQTNDSFHHLFVKAGEVLLKAQDFELVITQGFGVFVPAGIGFYQLITRGKAVILKTFV